MCASHFQVGPIELRPAAASVAAGDRKEQQGGVEQSVLTVHGS
jgi:hypothetical protein